MSQRDWGWGGDGDVLDEDRSKTELTGSRPLMGHCLYESFVLLPLKLCVKFEWSIIKHCKKYLRKCEITNLFMRLTTPTLWPTGALSGCGQHA